MTTARDVIAAAICSADPEAGGPCVCGIPACRTPLAMADAVITDLLSAPESVRLELAAMLNPWRPIETAPRDGTQVLIREPDVGTRVAEWMPIIFGGPKGHWYCGGNIYIATHWLPLPAPPSEDK